MHDHTPGANEEQWLRAGDPETPLALLAELAYEYPELRPIVAINPSSYQGLLDWLAQLDDPEVTRALAARHGLLAETEILPQTPDEDVHEVSPTEGMLAGATIPFIAPEPAGDVVLTGAVPTAESFSFATFIRRPGAWIAVGTVAAAIVMTIVISSVAAATSRAEQEQEAVARLAASQQEEAAKKASPAPKPSPSPTPTPPPVVEAPQTAGPTWSFANKSGFSYDMTMSVGTATRYSKDSPPSFLQGNTTQKAGTACTIDPVKDVVIPVTWSAKATTQDFKTTVSMRAIFRQMNQKYAGQGIAPFDRDNRVMVEQFFSSGPKCSTFSSTNLWGYAQAGGFSVVFQNELAAGASVRTRFFVIVKNYYTPATPSGDTALLDWITIRPIFGGNNAEDANVYRETNANLGIYSLTGITLNGDVVTAG